MKDSFDWLRDLLVNKKKFNPFFFNHHLLEKIDSEYKWFLYE